MQEETISGHQVSLLMMVSALALKTISLPSFFYEDNRQDSLYSFFLLLIVDVFILLLIWFIISKNPHFSFSQFCEKYFGRWSAKLIYLLAFAIYFFKTQMLLGETFSYLRDTFFPEAELYLYLFIMVILALFINFYGLRAFARTLEIFAWVIYFGIIVCMAMPFFSGHVSLFMLPIQNGLGKIFINAGRRSLWFGDFLWILILFDKMKFEKKSRKFIAGYLIFSIVFLVILYLVFFCIYSTNMEGMRNALTDIVSYTRKSIGIASIDWVPIFVLMYLTCFQIGFYFLIAKVLFEKIIERKSTFKFSCLWASALLMCIYFWLINMQIVEVFCANVFCYPALVFNYGIPLILFFITLYKMVFKRKKLKHFLCNGSEKQDKRIPQSVKNFHQRKRSSRGLRGERG